MINTSQSVNKYPSREKFLTNFAIKTWLEERYKKVLAEGDAKRIARYDGITPTKIMVEEPEIFDRDKGYFRSTLVARWNGILFPDPQIALPTFDEFLEHIDPDKELYGKEDIPESLTFSELIELANNADTSPASNVYALTKIDGSSHYALLVTSATLLLDLDEIFEKVFDEYMFQKIKGYALELTDPNYPKGGQISMDGYITGSITVEDVLLQEQSVVIDIFNLKLVKKLGVSTERLYNGVYTYNGDITYSQQ